MKKLILCFVICLAFPLLVTAQGEKIFPGLSAYNREVLNAARQITPVPLPTWLPSGFTVEKVNVKLGSTVAIEDRVLAVIYSRKLENGKVQRFSIEAGFEGLGDLPYDSTSSVRSAVGRIDIAYQPPDLDGDGKKLLDFSMTHWFNVGKTAFHFDGMFGARPNDRRQVMISLADTRKILASLKRF